MILLSHNLNESTPEYANGDSLKIFSICSIANDDSCNKMGLSMDLHTGTHVDFPRHFCNHGSSIDELEDYGIFSFSKWKLIEIEVEPRSLINDLDFINLEIDNEVTLLLIRTGWESKRHERENYALNGPGLHSELAVKLRQKFPNLIAVGFDFISLTSYAHREHGRIAHKRFLCDIGLIVIEDVKLADFNEFEGTIQMVPWQIQGADGVPVTIIWSKQ